MVYNILTNVIKELNKRSNKKLDQDALRKFFAKFSHDYFLAHGYCEKQVAKIKQEMRSNGMNEKLARLNAGTGNGTKNLKGFMAKYSNLFKSANNAFGVDVKLDNGAILVSFEKVQEKKNMTSGSFAELNKAHFLGMPHVFGQLAGHKFM